jgi:catalase
MLHMPGVVNRYPENYFAEVERAAFSPANVVPGVSFSPDKMLEGRLSSYGDTQGYRPGVNSITSLLTPKCPFHSYHRDGQMRTDGNLEATTAYNPNSQGLWDNQPEYAEPALTLEGDVSHYDHRLEDDHWEQPTHADFSMRGLNFGPVSRTFELVSAHRLLVVKLIGSYPFRFSGDRPGMTDALLNWTESPTS